MNLLYASAYVVPVVQTSYVVGPPKMFDLFEPAGEDEEGAHNVTVTEDMSPEDVLNRVMEVISKV